jgi:hypothetical protein
LLSVQVILGAAVSSSSLITTVRRLIVFILISLYYVKNSESFVKVPFFIVTLPTLASPSILMAAKFGLLPCRCSINLVSLPRPIAS